MSRKLAILVAALTGLSALAGAPRLVPGNEATLNWSSSLTNGTLEGVTGFKLYWGGSPGSYTNSAPLGMMTEFTAMVHTTNKLQLWFMISGTLGTNGLETKLSKEVSVVFNATPSAPRSVRSLR